MFVNVAMLYSILVEYEKKDLADIGVLFRNWLQANLQAERVAPHKIDKSVLGSMNDLAFMYQYLIVYRGGTNVIDLYQLIYDVNRTPQLKWGGHYSIKLLKDRLAAVQA
ncbi:MAG: hypothetical protein KDJ52_32180 [Anaerolineae bacterium]|nr:hypothetical protein [Anaerolineae bacterium]